MSIEREIIEKTLKSLERKLEYTKGKSCSTSKRKLRYKITLLKQILENISIARLESLKTNNQTT